MVNLGECILALSGFVGGAAIISGLVLRRIDKMNKKLDDQEAARIDESVLIITGLRAIGHLAEATAIAQRDGHTNGEMKTAMEYYTSSKDGLTNFLTLQAAKQTHAKA